MILTRNMALCLAAAIEYQATPYYNKEMAEQDVYDAVRNLTDADRATITAALND